MAQQIGEDTKITLDLKTIGILLFFVATVVGMWFTLQSDIEEAKVLPLPVVPEVFEQEFRMKDEAIRGAVMETNTDVKRLEEQLKIIDGRLYDLQQR
jgi:hypothetical protein